MVLPVNNDDVGPSALYESFWADEVGDDENLIRRGDRPCRAILVTSSGALVVTRPDGTNVTLPDAGAPVVFDIQAIALVAASSAATGIVVYW